MGLKRTTVYLPESLHRALRLKASAAGTTLSALVVEAVNDLLGVTGRPGGLAELIPTHSENDLDEQPSGLLAAVGAWEDVDGLDELDRILAEARQQARDRDVEPLER